MTSATTDTAIEGEGRSIRMGASSSWIGFPPLRKPPERQKSRMPDDEPQAEIKVRDNGPYKVTGPVRIVDPEGNAFEVEPGRPVALCRCGQSRTKPFCDASHKEAGFSSCVRA
jgi:CDGSH-type Zn-finger protein